jgi:hypothetical protein
MSSSDTSLSQRLHAAADSLEHEVVRIRDLLELQGSAALGGVLTLLAIPGLLPSFGIGWLLSLGMMAVGLAMLVGADQVKLPEKVSSIAIKRELAQKLLRVMAKVYGWTEKVARPRWHALTERGARRWLGAKVLLMAFIIFLPIPAGNTLPAIALLILGPALMFRDGFAVIASLAAAVVAVVGTSALVAGMGWAAWQAAQATIATFIS